MFLNLKSQYGNRRTSGFTLLELLLVVFIMSVLAFSAISLTDTMDSSQDQYRYERAKNQAIELKKAIIDRVVGQEVVSGFVADMGNFPIDMAALAFGISDLAQKDKRYMQSTTVNPYYDSTTIVGLLGTPPLETFRNSTADSYGLPLIDLQTIKGFRGSLVVNEEDDPDDLLADDFLYGSYLELKPGNNTYTGVQKPRFDNGWGTLNGVFFTSRAQPGTNLLSNDDKTHGWKWEASIVNSSEQFLLHSLGKNGIADDPNSGVELYSTDLLITSIDYDEWSVEAASIEVEVVNDVADLNGFQFRAALLVFDATHAEQATDPEGWRTIPSTSVITSINLGQTYSLAFSQDARVPAGTHILLITGANREPSTRIGFVEEVSSGSSGQPEKQRVVVSDHAVYQLELTLPNDDDVLETKTSPSGSSLQAALDALNQLFEEDSDFEIKPISYQYNSPFSYDIEIDIEGISGKQNSDFNEIDVLLPANPPDVVRGKRVHINPKQGNKLLVNLSTIVAQ